MNCESALNGLGVSSMTLKTSRRDCLRKMLTSFRILGGIQRLKLPISRCCKLLDECGSHEALSDRSWIGPLGGDASFTTRSIVSLKIS